MGIWFEITLINQDTKEIFTDDYFVPRTGEKAWNDVLTRALELANRKFEEDKYWMLPGIKDITGRGFNLPAI